MAKTNPTASSIASALSGATIIYIGPAGQVSPVFGPLGVGERYQATEAFAAYLVATHPDYWQRPAAPALS